MASPTVVSANGFFDNTSTTSFTVNNPGGINDGDTLIVGFSLNANNDVVGTPAGWVPIGATTNRLKLFQLPVASASGLPGSWTFTVLNSCSHAGGILVLRPATGGLKVSVDLSSYTTPGGNNTSHEAPSVTASGDALLICAVFTTGNASPTYTPPSGMVEQVDIGCTTGNPRPTFTMATEAVGSGATGTKSFTCTSNFPRHTMSMLAYEGDPEAVVTEGYGEVLRNGEPPVKVTELYVETLTSIVPESFAHVYESYGESMSGAQPDRQARIWTSWAEVLRSTRVRRRAMIDIRQVATPPTGD